MPRACFHSFALFCMVVQFGAWTSAAAQATLSTQEMVDRLRLEPRTRGLVNHPIPALDAKSRDRNFIIERTSKSQENSVNPSTPTAQEQIAGRPSLSLLIQFEFDSTQVRPESVAALKTLALALQSSELAGSHFAVEGHTDARGRSEYNQQLSSRRAESVREVLAHYGADASRLIATGKGASEPVNAADPFSAENRRVRIVNLD